MPEAATLFKEWAGYLKPEDVTRLETAYHFSEAAHNGQYRASGDPYISHPLAVANILAQLHLDPQALTRHSNIRRLRLHGHHIHVHGDLGFRGDAFQHGHAT